MIDWEQEIEIKWNRKNKKTFTDIGIEFTKYGDVFKIPINKLQNNSHYHVSAECDYCGRRFDSMYCTLYKGYKLYPKIACKYCSTKKTADMKRQNNANKMYNKVLNRAKDLNYTIEFDFENYHDQKSDFKIICPKHGEHIMAIVDFIAGNTCPQCGRERQIQSAKISKEEVVRRINSVNGNELLNADEYVSAHSVNLLVKCKCGNIFHTSLSNYYKQYRCQTCVKSESLGENKIKEYLDAHRIDYIQQYKYPDCIDKKPLPFDFKIIDKDICIEYDGAYHFAPIRGKEALEYTQKHDKIKNDYCKLHNINLIRIKQIPDIRFILDKELKLCK